jgi:PQQ-like domain
VRQSAGGAKARNGRTGKAAKRLPGTRRFLRRVRRQVAKTAVGSAVGRAGSKGGSRLRGVRLGTARRSPWLRRGALAAALLAVALVPFPEQGTSPIGYTAACRGSCHAVQLNMLKWHAALPGSWDVDAGVAGTSPASGLAFAAVGNGVAAVGAGMTVYAFDERTGKPLWPADALSGFPANAAITSVRTWPGEVTAGVTYQASGGATKRYEVVIPDVTGVQSAQYPAALFGGAVAATTAYTVIVGPTAVTSYDNATGRIRWQRPTGQAGQGWQTDGQYLYVTDSIGGYLGSAPVTALRRIDTATGAEQEILPIDLTAPESAGITTFDGTLSGAFDDVVLFQSASGVTAYSDSTGILLWSRAGAVTAGTDPQQHAIYLTRGSSLLEVDPLTGKTEATASGSIATYVVRGGVALGLDSGADGDAWGYDIAAQRIITSALNLGWPHYFTDLSGLGGSADPDGDLVVIAACTQVGPAVTASPSPTADGSPAAPPSPDGSPDASPSPTATSSAAVTQPCVHPELVALGL